MNMKRSGLLVLSVLLSFATFPAWAQNPHCQQVGGGIITNVGVISPDRTLGTATGDLKGAVGVQLISQTPGPNGTTVFSVHHFWVTEAGDTISVEPAKLTALPVATRPGLFAVVNYPVSISGGTGKFKGATGTIYVIGEADFNVADEHDPNAGQIGLRYSGQVCFGNSESDKSESE